MQLPREQGSESMVKFRTLTKTVGTGVFTSDAESPQGFSVEGSGQGWEVLTAGTHNVAVWKGTIDLAGYALDDQTWFTSNVMMQGQNYLDAITTGICTIHDIITAEPISDTDLLAAFYLNTPGLETSSVNSENILYGRVRTWGPRNFDAAGAPVVGPLTSLNQQMFNEDYYGTNVGTARDKLYCYRVMWFVPAPGQVGIMYLGPAMFVISGAVDKEESLEYFMRLKRAYETAPPFS